MIKGAKFVIGILAALFLISLLMLLRVNSDKEALVQQYSEKEKVLVKKAEDLSTQLTAIQPEKRRLDDKLAALKKDLDGITSERDSWKRKYDTALKEKEDLIEKMKEVTTRVAEKPAAAEVKIAPASEESYWAEVLKDKASLELQLNDLKSKLTESNVQIEEAKKGKVDVEVDIARLKQINEDLENKIKFTTDLANNLSLDLAKEKNEKKSVEDKVGKLKEDNMALRYQIKELAASKVSLEKGLQKLTADKDKLSKRLMEAEQLVQSRINEVLDIKKDIEAKLGQVSSASAGESKPIELAPIVVRSNSARPGANIVNLSGKVVSIDEANNFVIIDLGEDAGVKIGDSFKIYHNNKQIASIEVIQTRKDISAADIKQKSQKIQAGDPVK